MSKAFTSEESSPELVVPPRPPLPFGVPNYVTPRGLELLRAEKLQLEAARATLDAAPEEGRAVSLAAWAARMQELEQRLSSAQLIALASTPKQAVRFGSKVSVVDAAGEQKTYEIVGVDEADPSQGKIAFLSPLAKALLGKRVGDAVELRTPAKLQKLEITHNE